MSFEIKRIASLDDKDRMEELINFVKIQASDEDNAIALMSNISSFIMAIIKDLNWAGFYLVGEDELILGPFQGLPACTRLSFDKGVCAKAYRDREIVKVDDVSKFSDHIVCDSNSASELVIPIYVEDEVVCLIDLDSPNLNRFTEVEVCGFEKISEILYNRIYL